MEDMMDHLCNCNNYFCTIYDECTAILDPNVQEYNLHNFEQLMWKLQYNIFLTCFSENLQLHFLSRNVWLCCRTQIDKEIYFYPPFSLEAKSEWESNLNPQLIFSFLCTKTYVLAWFFWLMNLVVMELS